MEPEQSSLSTMAEKKANEEDSGGSSSGSRSYDIARSPFRCSDCGSSYRQRTDFNEHLRATHPRATISYVCSYCGLEHIDFDALCQHVAERHRNRRMFECAHCKSWFTQRQAIKRHLERHNERRMRRTCSLCAVVFSSRQKFKSHWSARHQLARGYVCGICGQRFTRSYNLRRHDLENHRRDGKTRRWVPSCDLCGKQFSTRAQLDEHTCKINSSEEPTVFICSICGKAFGCEDNMLRHKKTHEGGEFKCKLCPRKFKSHDHLLRHIRFHKRTKKYPCPNCGKVYLTGRGLARHKKICKHPVAGPSNAKRK